MDHSTQGSRQANSEEAVVDAIRRMIVESRFDEDERITESSLSRKLGASRTPVRMALKLLHAEGILIKLEGVTNIGKVRLNLEQIIKNQEDGHIFARFQVQAVWVELDKGARRLPDFMREKLKIAEVEK